MQRYFFNVHDGRDRLDHEGALFASLKEAQRAAVRYAADLIRDDPDHVWSGEEWTMEVKDDAGCILFILYFHIVLAPMMMRPAV